MLPIKRTVKNCKRNRGHIYMGRKRIEARIKKEAVEAVKSGKLTQSEARSVEKVYIMSIKQG